MTDEEKDHLVNQLKQESAASPVTLESCSNCRCGFLLGTGRVECREQSPRVFCPDLSDINPRTNAPRHASLWPKTNANYWCAKWTARRNPETRSEGVEPFPEPEKETVPNFAVRANLSPEVAGIAADENVPLPKEELTPAQIRQREADKAAAAAGANLNAEVPPLAEVQPTGNLKAPAKKK